MADYTKKPQALVFRKGMCLTLPGDRLTQEYFQYLQNVRSYLIGEWRQRPGMSLIGSAPDAASIYFSNRLNNNTTGTFRRFIGTSNGDIYIDDLATHSIFSLVDNGFSGKRYASLISRPDRSTNPFLFIGSDTKNSKFSVTGTRSEWGLSAPINPPDADASGWNFTEIVRYLPGVVPSGTVSTGSLASAIRCSGGPGGSPFFAVIAMLYDNPTINNGMVTAVFAIGDYTVAPYFYQTTFLAAEGSVTAELPSGTVDTVLTELFLPIATTTIAAIVYDSGTTGLCTIQLSIPTPGLKRRCAVGLGGTGNTIASGVEVVQVLSATIGLNGLPSFRCSTANNHIVGERVQGTLSYRANVTTSPTHFGDPGGTGDVVVGAQWTNPGTGVQTFTQAVTLNLSNGNISKNGLDTNRALQDDDFFHIGLNSDFSKIIEVQIQFDINDGTYTNDYLYTSIRPPDLQGSYSQTTSSPIAQKIQTDRVQSDQFTQSSSAQTPKPLLPNNPDIANPTGGDLGDINRVTLDGVNYNFDVGNIVNQGMGPISTPVVGGAFNWADFFIPLSQFQRFGVTPAIGWKDVKSWRISINFGPTPPINTFWDSPWVGGGYGPNTTNIPEYQYVYRARNTQTGSRSNLSPPTRYTVSSRRRLVSVTIPPYPDPQADVIDIFRIGGLLQSYTLIGTIPSSTTQSQVFQDDTRDDMSLRNPIAETNRFKPWVIPALPVNGICNVVGTTVTWVSGGQFNTQWVRGTQIIIAGLLCTLYTNPASTTFLTLNESVRAQTNVPFQLPEPTLDGQPLPGVFGPYAGASGEFNFAVGDPLNPGFLYWTNGNDPESVSDLNWIELCPPSEKLMNGCVLDGVVYCFSDKRNWRILPAFAGGQSSGSSDFYPQETTMGKGLIGRYALAIGDMIYFVSFDGIYASRGDALQSLTDDSMAPLFRRDGANTGFSAPVSPVDFTFPDEITLTYSFDGLYFSYQGIDGSRYTFYFSFLTRGWVLDTIGSDAIIKSFREIRSLDADNVLVGTKQGDLLIRSNSVFTDNLQPINCRILDREEIWEDQGLRTTKQVGDLMVDLNANGSIIIPTLRYENNTSNDVLPVITGTGRTQTPLDVNAGAGRIVRGVALDLTWNNGSSAVPSVYAWEPWALIKPDKEVNRASDWENGGYTGLKWLQGFRLKADTFGANKSFTVQIDGGTTVQTFTFNGNGEQVETFWLQNPVVCHEMRIIGSDGTTWRYYGTDWIFEPEPEQAAVWETQVTSLDQPFFHHIREVMIAHNSTTDITMTVYTDNVTNNYIIPNSGGVRSRTYLPLKSLKAKFHKFRFTSVNPFSLWLKDNEVRAKSWGSQWGQFHEYTIQRPFGDISRQNGGSRI